MIMTVIKRKVLIISTSFLLLTQAGLIYASALVG